MAFDYEKHHRICSNLGIEVYRGFSGGRFKHNWFGAFNDEGDAYETGYYDTRLEAELAAIDMKMELEDE